MTTAGAGASAIADIEFAVTGNDGSTSTVATRTQDTIMALLKSQVQASAGWTGSSTSVFQGVPGGLPGLFIAFVKKVVGDGVGTFETLEEAFTAAAENLLTNRSPLHVGALTTAQPNLVSAFNSGSILPGSEWTVDLDLSTDGSGCAQVIANGLPHALRSGSNPLDTIPVGVGQTLTATVSVCYSGYSGIGDPPILLQLVPFDANKVAGEPVTLQEYTPASDSLAWPGDKLTGSYAVPAGVNSVQLRIYVSDGALAGTLDFSAASLIQASTLPTSFVTGLEQFITTVPPALQANIQAIIDVAVQTLTGSTSVNNSLTDLIFAWGNIRPESVGGVLGPGTIGDAIKGVVNNLIGGLVGQAGDGAGLADLFNIGNQVSSNAAQGANAWQIQGIRDNTSASSGFLPNGRSNYDLTASAFKSTAPTILVTATVSAACFDRVTVSQPLGVISWVGFGNTNISAFYINVWKWNAATVGWDLVHHSPNIVSALVSGTTAADSQYMFYPPADPIAQVATEQYLYQYVSVGTGTHHMIGETTGSWLPNHPTAPSSAYGYTRDESAAPNSPPSFVAKASFPSANTVPWTEVAINDGGAVGDTYDPELNYFNEPGTVPIPKWADLVDVVVLGKGGNAAAGTLGFYGNPGTPGAYNTTTWSRGTHFTDPATVITFAGSSVSIPGYAVAATNGIDGTGTRLAILGKPVGRGPGTLDYNGIPAGGGEDQTVFGGDGTTPGGAANGGTWFGLYTAGGQGGPPAAWVQFRQNAMPGETPGSGTGDITAPAAPTLSAVGVTRLSVTVTTGSGYPALVVDLDGVAKTRTFGPMQVVRWGPPGASFPYTFPGTLS